MIGRKRPGDIIYARDMNLIVRAVRSALNITGPNVFQNSEGTHIRRDPQLAFKVIPAKIRNHQALAGATDRYQYSWIEQWWDTGLSPDNWENKPGGDSSTQSANEFARPAYNASEWEANGVGTWVRTNEIVMLVIARGESGESIWFGAQPATAYAGKITARSGTTNATYSAQAYSDSTVAVTTATPANRIFSTDDVTWAAAAVNDPCLLLVESDETITLWAAETVDTTSCADVESTAPGGDIASVARENNISAKNEYDFSTAFAAGYSAGSLLYLHANYR